MIILLIIVVAVLSHIANYWIRKTDGDLIAWLVYLMSLISVYGYYKILTV